MELMNNDEAAHYLGLSPGTLPRWRWMRYGPPFLKIGRKVMYRREDLETYLVQRRIDPGELRADSGQ